MWKIARIILFITIAATLATAFAACSSSPGAAMTPALTSVSPNQGCQGQSLTVTISGTNLDDATAVSFGDGISANSFTVDSSGTQITANITIDSAATAGPMDVSVTAPGGTGTLPGGFTVMAAAPSSGLFITTASLPAGDVNVAYHQTLSASGGSGRYGWSITSGSLPAGLSLKSTTGAITGKPNAAGTSAITFTVTDALGATASQTLSITINPKLTITTTSLSNGDVSVAYSQTLSASGGSGTYAWSITSGSLPTGLSLDNSTGAIAGTPTTAHTSTITFKVADTLGATASQRLSITVNPGAAASIVISPDEATITADDSQDYYAEAYDYYGNDLGDVTTGTTFSMDSRAGGSCWGNFCLPSYAGTWTVTGTYGSLTATATLNVNPGALDYIVISPDDATITADDSQGYHAEAYDYYGNDLGDVTPHTTFTIDTDAHGSWSGDVYTPKYAGDWIVTGTYRSLTATADLSVDPGAAARIVISPDTATITVDDSQDYYAEAYDACGNDLGDVTTDTTFTGAGGSWLDNSYTAENAGTWTVTGTYGSLTDTAKLTVVN
jgi:hypothetical protein